MTPTRTTALLKLYLKENTTLTPDKINEIIRPRQSNSDIEVDGLSDDGDDERPTSSPTKEIADVLRKIADQKNSEWEQPRKKIVSNYTADPKKYSLTSMLNTYFQKNPQSIDNVKAAFALKCLADITIYIKDSRDVKNAAEEVWDLVNSYSL